MKFALVGTGAITAWFLREARLCSAFEAIAIVSRSREQAIDFAQKHDIPLAYDSLDQVACNPNIDAVYIASPNASHMAQAIQMLKAGKHVFCEKPIASNVQELQLMLDCARRNQRLLFEGIRNAYAPNLAVLRMLVSGMGQPRRAMLSFCRYSSRYDRFREGENVNTFNPDLSNSALMDMGVYCVRLMLELFGQPLKIAAASVRLANGFEGSGTILASYPAMTAELLYSKIATGQALSEIQFENGCIQIQDMASLDGITLYKNGRTELSLLHPQNTITAEVDYFTQLSIGDAGYRRACDLSLAALTIMDEARRQCGIVFPADQAFPMVR